MICDVLGTEKLTTHKIVLFSRSCNAPNTVLAAQTKETGKENVNLSVMIERYIVRKGANCERDVM